MTIAYIMRYWPVYGGGETITATLANELVRRGHSVHILYTYRNDVAPKPYIVDKRVVETQLNTVACTTQNAVAMAEYLTTNHVDVMVNQWGNHKLCYKAKLLSGTKLVICWHLDIVRDQTPADTKQRLLKLLVGKRKFQAWRKRRQIDMHVTNNVMSNRYVFLSQSFVDDYKRRAGNRAIVEKIASISNPLTYDFQYDINNYDKKENEVLFVGRIFEYHKRVSYILKTWKMIEADNSLNDWRLRIVGDGPDMDASQKLCRHLNLQRVSFEGFCNPRPFYQQASIFMMTSAFEGFGMTLVEAQQYAVVPIVMDTYLSLHDIINDGGNGVIVADNDLIGFAEKMKQLMLDKDRRKRMALNGLDVCRKFKVNHIADQWEQLFVDILDR